MRWREPESWTLNNHWFVIPGTFKSWSYLKHLQNEIVILTQSRRVPTFTSGWRAERELSVWHTSDSKNSIGVTWACFWGKLLGSFVWWQPCGFFKSCRNSQNPKRISIAHFEEKKKIKRFQGFTADNLWLRCPQDNLCLRRPSSSLRDNSSVCFLLCAVHSIHACARDCTSVCVCVLHWLRFLKLWEIRCHIWGFSSKINCQHLS